MHKSLTPWRNARLAVFGIGIALVLFIVAMVLPFYSYTYFFQGTSMTFADCMKANKQMVIPFVMIVVALVLEAASLVMMILFPKNKICQHLNAGFSFASAFIFIGILIISVCRLWVIPYTFEYLAQQTLEAGYLMYILFLLFNGVLTCYMTAIGGKVEELAQ